MKYNKCDTGSNKVELIQPKSRIVAAKSWGGWEKWGDVHQRVQTFSSKFYRTYVQHGDRH